VPPTKSGPSVDMLAEYQAAAKALAPAVKRLEKALKNLDPSKIPIGAVSDTLYALRAAAKLPKLLNDPFEDIFVPAIKALEDYFIETLKVGESSGVQGHLSRVQVTDSTVPVVSDWPKFYAYIKKNSAFELLNRAVNKAAVSERWEQKKQIPGVSAFKAKKVSCTKLGGK